MSEKEENIGDVAKKLSDRHPQVLALALKTSQERVENGPAPTISAVEEPAGLLRRRPVEIRIAPDVSRVHIREKQSWRAANWEVSKRISQLVFMPEVLEHLWALGLEVVTGRNIKDLSKCN